MGNQLERPSSIPATETYRVEYPRIAPIGDHRPRRSEISLPHWQFGQPFPHKYSRIGGIICAHKFLVDEPRAFAFVAFVDAVNDDGLGVPKHQIAQNSARAEADIGRTNARVDHQYEIDVGIAERMDDLMAASDQRFAKRRNHAVSTTPRPCIRHAANRNLHDVLPR